MAVLPALCKNVASELSNLVEKNVRILVMLIFKLSRVSELTVLYVLKCLLTWPNGQDLGYAVKQP